MTRKLTSVCLLWICATTFFLAAARTDAAEMKLEAQLVWGTNDSQPLKPKHKAVDADVAAKLKKLPFKWEHYFEIRRKEFTVPEGGERTIEMSGQCQIKVKNLGKSKVEVHLLGRGKPVGRIGQELPKGELLVTGGNAENLTAWFVVLKQID